MDRIKKLKIKKQDGTFSDYIPIGADAENIDTTDGESVETKLNKKPYYYNSVADMKADTKLKAGDMVITLGYYEANDGGGAEYKIQTSSSKYYEELNNQLVAELLIQNDIVNVDCLGAKGDGITNDSEAIQKACNFATNIYFSNKTYLLNTPISVLNNNFITSPNTEFINIENLPGFNSNSWHRKNRTFFSARPSKGKISDSGTHYGESALSTEIIPEDTFIGNAVSLFSSARAKSNSKCDVWARNAIVNVENGYKGTVVGDEIDVNTYGNPDDTNTVGLGITGIGNYDADTGLFIQRADNTKWNAGIRFKNIQTGIIVENPKGGGMIVDNAGINGVAVNNPNDYAYLANGGKIGLNSSGASEYGVSVGNTPVGLNIASTVTNLGIQLHDTGIKFADNSSTLFKITRSVMQIESVTIPAHSSIEKTFSPANYSVSPDETININPYNSVPSGLMWSARISGTTFAVRLGNVSDNNITLPASTWLVTYFKFSRDN